MTKAKSAAQTNCRGRLLIAQASNCPTWLKIKKAPGIPLQQLTDMSFPDFPDKVNGR